ncbi:MAG: acyl-CoA thioesterase [Myxococcales bacterium]|nr:acyl-CoA thioesterase [Myxococcales bacterium]MDH3484002.1 acyl-CoA thioesterase [Myxococcales bacterium]
MTDPVAKLVKIDHTIRGIETDASSTVGPGWIARMLERVRWSVFGLETFALRNRVVGGVARASAFEYLEPLRADDEVEIATWLARVGNTSYDFGHAISRLSDQAVAVRARVTVVHIGPDGPAPVGADLASTVLDEPVPPAVLWQESERRSSWTRQWIVRPSDQDSFRHVNQARYVDYIDDTRQLASMAGEAAGIEGPLESLSVEYLRETHAGQLVRMQTWVTGDETRAFELTEPETGQVHSRGQIRKGPASQALI